MVDTAGYQAQTVEKVERLLELLTEIGGHPFLGPRLRLHGGTALNVFHLRMPRLSVDADLTYMGRVPRDEYLAERPLLEKAVIDLAVNLGYKVSTKDKVEHAGRTLKLLYRYGGQDDLVKVDLVYLNRAPLLESEHATCMVCSPETSVRTLALPELIAGKTKALFDRPAIRDLYDIYRIQTGGLALMTGSKDLRLLQRRVRIYYVSMSQPYPCPIDRSVVDKFAGIHDEVESQLYPVLRADDRPTLEQMMDAAAKYVDEHVAARDEEDLEYLRLLSENEYRPDLLFSQWPAVLRQAIVSPAAAWKLQNLKNRPAPAPSDYPEW